VPRLRRPIAAAVYEGLALSPFGIVILSPTFFAKQWPRLELDGLVAKETLSGQKVILPVWHKVDASDVAKFSPTLAGKLAARSSDGIAKLVKQILRVLRRP
jgi:hypothetical protein